MEPQRKFHYGRVLVAALVITTALVVLVYGSQWSESAEADRYGVIERDGKRLLWGGEDERQHFDIKRFDLKPQGLSYGVGREHFPALVAPEFVPAQQADFVKDDWEVVVVNLNDEVRVYPIPVMTLNEAVNDTIGETAICVVYCAQAHLAAAYLRSDGDRTRTFAVSGYTYADPKVWDGRNAFVLWDRETESLWWPPIGKAVSGPSRGLAMPLLDPAHWAQTTWGAVRDRYPDAQVLTLYQSPDPDTLPGKSETTVLAAQTAPRPEETDAAPRWGENDALEGSGAG
jgi:hypothetical protein